LFARAASEIGLAFPSSEDAVWTVIRFHVAAIADRRVSAREGVYRIHRDADQFTTCAKFAGDSHGIEHFLGAYRGFYDLEERPDEISFEGKYGQDAWVAFGEYVIKCANEWLAIHGR